MESLQKKKVSFFKAGRQTTRNRVLEASRGEKINRDEKDGRYIAAGTVLLESVQCSITFTAMLILTWPNLDPLLAKRSINS